MHGPLSVNNYVRRGHLNKVRANKNVFFRHLVRCFRSRTWMVLQQLARRNPGADFLRRPPRHRPATVNLGTLRAGYCGDCAVVVVPAGVRSHSGRKTTDRHRYKSSQDLKRPPFVTAATKRHDPRKNEATTPKTVGRRRGADTRAAEIS